MAQRTKKIQAGKLGIQSWLLLLTASRVNLAFMTLCSIFFSGENLLYRSDDCLPRMVRA